MVLVGDMIKGGKQSCYWKYLDPPSTWGNLGKWVQVVTFADSPGVPCRLCANLFDTQYSQEIVKVAPFIGSCHVPFSRALWKVQVGSNLNLIVRRYWK